MPSRHSSTPSQRQLSPPWSAGGSPYLHSDLYVMAPPTSYMPLPPCYDHYHPELSPHHGLITPPPSPARVHQALSSSTTVVRYDFAADPETIRMSSSSPYPSPNHDFASSPSATVLHIRCQVTGGTITVHDHNGITCLDLFIQLHNYFNRDISSEEWRSVRGPQRDAMKGAYERRTGRQYVSSSRMKRVDYLLGWSRFKRLLAENTDASGSTWLLHTY